MQSSPSITKIGSLIGDRARGEMLAALMDGRALTAKELAFAGRITPQTASEHLRKLVHERILQSTTQGRFRYFRLASQPVSQMLESMMVLAADTSKRRRSLPANALIQARMCYDHLAGVIGVKITDALIRANHVILSDEGGELTEAGEQFFNGFGMDIAGARRKRRIFCRPCMDWSERRFHLAGSIGAALAQRSFQLRWIKRMPDSRALMITPAGLDGLAKTWNLSPDLFSVRVETSS
jgi:DNA-binding transcriptional ArsR family regulator